MNVFELPAALQMKAAVTSRSGLNSMTRAACSSDMALFSTRFKWKSLPMPQAS
jgi:hypothetical protein